MPLVWVAVFLIHENNMIAFYQQVFINNSKLLFSFNQNSPLVIGGFFFGSLILPWFMWLSWVALSNRKISRDIILAIFMHFVLLVVLVLRPFPHYGLFNLCCIVWICFLLRHQINSLSKIKAVALVCLAVMAVAFQLLFVTLALRRGTILTELEEYRNVRALANGTIQVFAGNPPRYYVLAQNLIPAFPYLFIYDTNLRSGDMG